MKGFVVVPTAVAVAWLVTPLIDVVTRGTVESRAVTAWRAEARRALIVDGPLLPDVVPTPRTSSESVRPVVSV